MPLVGRFGRFFTTLVMLSLVGIWLIFAGICYDAYRGEWRGASLVANNVAILLERDIARNIELYDLSLKAVVKGLADPKVMALPRDLQRGVLFDSSASASGLGSILVVNADGVVTMDSRAETPKALSVADRDYFRIYKDGDASDTLFVSAPFRSRLKEGEWSLGLSRRLNNPDGSFAGIVVGAVRLSYVLSLFNDVRLPSGSTVTLFDKAGHVIVRSPFSSSNIGLLAGSAYEFLKSGKPIGEFTRESNFDGVRRLFVYRQIGSLPIVQSVGLSINRFLLELMTRVAILAAAFFIVSALIGALAISLRKELRQRAAAETALAQLATIDSLTQLANRRRFDEVLAIEWRRGARSGASLALLMIDCDLFKTFNDANGHLGGDATLRAVADAIKASVLRPSDLPARFGGEEFVVLLPITDLAGALAVGEALRTRIMHLNIAHPGSPYGRVTVSIGAACLRAQADTDPTALIQAADQALYAAKAQGRNAVVAADMPDLVQGSFLDRRSRAGS